MKSLAPYPSPEQRQQRFERWTDAAGGSLLRYGDSVEQRPLYLCSIPALGDTRMRVLCTANIHGVEFISTWVALELLKRLSSPRGIFRALRQNAEIWIAPSLNPDGYAKTWRTNGEDTLAKLRGNANGVDLNRNFPPPTGKQCSNLPWAGSDRPGSANFRGTTPLSEPESAALDRVLKEQHFSASVNLHSFMGKIIPARVSDREDYRRYKELAQLFSSAQRRYRYGRLSSRLFDVYTGELEDHQHHNHGCWGFCVESMTVGYSLGQHLRAPSLFWRFNPRKPKLWAENDVPAIATLLLGALQTDETL